MATIAAADWMQGTVTPLAGEVRFESTPWEDAAVVDRDAFRRSLKDAGLSAGDARQALKVRDEVAVEVGYLDGQIEKWRAADGDKRYVTAPPELVDLYSRQGSALERLRGWLSNRRFKVESRETVKLRMPLFVFAAADQPGCTATVEFGSEKKASAEWGVTVFGTGLGGNADLKVTTSDSFPAAAGEVKVVTVTVSVVVESGTRLKDGTPVGAARRLDGSKLRQYGELGLLLLDKGKAPPLGDYVTHYPLAGDTTGAPSNHKRTYERTVAHKLTLGAKAFGADLSIGASVELSSSVSLSYDLAGGVDYQLHTVRDGDGYLWLPAAPETRKRKPSSSASTRSPARSRRS